MALQLHLLLRRMQKNKSAFRGMLFATGSGVIFNTTGLSLPIDSSVRVVLSLIINQHKKNMKEYKVVSPKLGFKNRTQKYEAVLNQHAREGWVVHSIYQSTADILFEREKNR